MLKFVIIIQARSTSTRFPGKCWELIGDKPMINHVIDACIGAEEYNNKYAHTHGSFVRTYLAVPKGDPLADELESEIDVYEGDLNDVLSRYVAVAKKSDADYIVRVTGDCPLIPEHIISKHMKIAAKTSCDYVSNVDPRFRTSIDGYDCEVISRRLLEHVGKYATSAYDKEHVTTYIRDPGVSWAKVRVVQGHVDFSDIKLSVDTPEDLEFVRKIYRQVEEKKLAARKEYGKDAINSF